MAMSRVSLPSGPSSSSPTGSPPAVMPAGIDSPGMPALLPGSVLRMKVPKVSTSGPPLIDTLPEPGSVLLMTAGLGVLGWRARQRARRA